MIKQRTKTWSLIMCLIIIGLEGYSQKVNQGAKMEIIEVTEPIVCYIGAESDHSFPFPFPSKHRNVIGKAKSANIEVTYVGFSNQPAAQAAFQYAVDIWAGLLNSPQTIRIRAEFMTLDDGVLGSASPAFLIRNFKNAPKLGINYPIALAEKIANQPLNTEEQFDIVTSFNNEANWYFDVDNPAGIGSGQTDFATVVLHELAHGLGFFSATNVDDNGIGGIGLFQSGTFPTAYTYHVKTTDNEVLVLDIPNNSEEMGDALTGNALRFGGPSTFARLYAPSEFSQGSSFSHLDNFYNGSSNSLMTPSIGTGSFVHDPGISLGIMKDTGWEFTYLEHDGLSNTEDFASDFAVVTKVTTDVEDGYDASSLIMHYSRDGFAIQDIEVPMEPTGNPDEFSATIPSQGEGVTYAYYLEVKDMEDRTITNPGTIIIDGKIEHVSFQFTADVDDSIPEIDHTPVDFVLDTKSEQVISASIVDYLMGVDTAYVEYLINDVAKPAFGLARNKNTLSLFDGEMDLSGVSAGDVVQYKITAIDSSMAANTATSPESGFHSFAVEGIPEPIVMYKNDFNSPSSDFLGTGFEIITPSNFEDGAIHSKHPYEEALDELEIDYLYQLKSPIIVDDEFTEVSFKEIVLVEPGADGSEFGDDDFWDYVVVEASIDDGENWFAIFDGYDSSEEPIWKQRYESDINDEQISEAVGDPTLYRERRFDLLDNSKIKSGETILFRFRLFSDQLAAGWGWAIDDLQIQGEMILSLEDEFEEALRIFPNPSERGYFTFNGTLKSEPENIHLEIVDLMGRKQAEVWPLVQGKNFAYALDLQAAPAGMYVARLTIDGQQISRKIVKAR